MSESCEAWSAALVGTPCWLEIPAVDVAACKAFYTALFPSWKFGGMPDEYDPKEIAGYSFEKPAGLHGGIIRVDPSCKAVAQNNGVGMNMSYLVESIEETQKQVLELGGSVVLEKTPEHENGWYSKYKDTEGNIFGVYEVKKKA